MGSTYQPRLRPAGLAAAEGDFGALVPRNRDVALDALALARGNEGADHAVVVKGVTDARRQQVVADCLDDLVLPGFRDE